MMPPRFYCVGTPLDDEGELHPSAMAVIESADLIIGESSKVTRRLIRHCTLKPDALVSHSDPPNPAESDLQNSTMEKMATTGGVVALMSDSGLPILFDPGVDLLKQAQRLGFEIHTTEATTSWGSAAALSGFTPPYWIEGFLPQEAKLRDARLLKVVAIEANTVLLDTPYRFMSLLKDLERVIPSRQCFLAWELTMKTERLLFGTPKELRRLAEKFHLSKGEFVFVIEAAKPTKSR